MTDEHYTGKVAFQSERERYYAIPDDVEDKNVMPDDCQTVRWVADNDDPEDFGGHFELVHPDDEVPMESGTAVELEAGTAEGGSGADL